MQIQINEKGNSTPALSGHESNGNEVILYFSQPPSKKALSSDSLRRGS